MGNMWKYKEEATAVAMAIEEEEEGLTKDMNVFDMQLKYQIWNHQKQLYFIKLQDKCIIPQFE